MPDQLIRRPVSIAPLITFRILFGGLMMVGALRFMFSGWIERLYGEPKLFFKYYGFEWVRVFEVPGMYALYATIAVSAAMVMLGFFYRAAITVFFLAFTYAELADLTNYLNHYYLVCLLAFLLIFLPAHRQLSLDVWRNPSLRITRVPAWTINVLILQLSIVYCCAGYAKLNPDWLLRAMPLSVWLPPPLRHPWTLYAFSWAGAIYDLSIPFFLLNRHARPYAYVAVVFFHGLTKALFNIGLFPFIMIFNTLIFFPGKIHEKWLKKLGWRQVVNPVPKTSGSWSRLKLNLLALLLSVFFSLQLTLPFRYLLYPGNVLWSEQGYRFAWRVMLVEKTGQATFYVQDPATGRRSEVVNAHYLTSFQEKQMAIQPDLILQFAHFLSKEYRDKYHIANPIVTVDSHVALNGRASRRFINPNINLAAVQDGLAPKPWILPFNDNL